MGQKYSQDGSRTHGVGPVREMWRKDGIITPFYPLDGYTPLRIAEAPPCSENAR